MDANHIRAWEQGNVARALVAGHGFGSPFVSNQPSAIMPPVYPLIVAGFFLLFGVHTPHAILAIHIFDCVMNALACIPIFLLARRSFGERTAVWAAWAWAFFPYGIYFSAAWAWSTHLLLLCLCWLLYLQQSMERSARLGLWAGFGLLAGFTALTEPSSLVLSPFLLALAAWKLAHNGKQWLVPGVVASLTLAATISPWLFVACLPPLIRAGPEGYKGFLVEGLMIPMTTLAFACRPSKTRGWTARTRWQIVEAR